MAEPFSYLSQPSPQAAAGLDGAHRGSQPPSQQASGDRPHLCLRNRPLHGQRDLKDTGVDPNTPVKDLPRRDHQASNASKPRGRGHPRRSAPRTSSACRRSAPTGDCAIVGRHAAILFRVGSRLAWPAFFTPVGPTPGARGLSPSQIRPIERRGMKVRASVKPMCEKCKVIRRGGAVLVICPEPPPQAEAGLTGWRGSRGSTSPSTSGPRSASPTSTGSAARPPTRSSRRPASTRTPRSRT